MVSAAARKADSSAFLLVLDVKYGSGRRKNSHDNNTMEKKERTAKEGSSGKVQGSCDYN